MYRGRRGLQMQLFLTSESADAVVLRLRFTALGSNNYRVQSTEMPLCMTACVIPLGRSVLAGLNLGINCGRNHRTRMSPEGQDWPSSIDKLLSAL